MLDFFDRQEHARKSSRQLVVMFVLAVGGVILAVNALAYAVAWVAMPQPEARFGVERDEWVRISDGSTPRVGPATLALPWHGGVTLVTLFVVLGGSVFRMVTLHGGGPAVARMMGGREVPPEPGRSIDDSRLRNVVEEMSLASGVPVPRLFVMEREQGINAFAAGWSPDDATIGVTRGALDRLTRDELQGVIAHEFSHLLHQDARLNLRLLGLNYGLLLVGLIGMHLLDGLSRASVRSSRRSGDNAAGLLLVLLLIGVGLTVIGYVGVFFGRLLQAAVSRQREFLADASAVQYTRNPDGLAGVLSKIANARSRGGRLEDRHAGELAHAFFVNGFSVGLSGVFGPLLATHPPIRKRLEALGRVDLIPPAVGTGPRWSGGESGAVSGVNRLDGDFGGTPRVLQGVRHTPASASRERRRAIPPEDVLRRVGEVAWDQVAHARRVRQTIAPELIQACHEPFAARTVLFALLTSGDDVVAARQLATLAPADAEMTHRLLQQVRSAGFEARLPLIDVCLPTLDLLSRSQRVRFLADLQSLTREDGRVTLFEFSLGRIVNRHLEWADPQRNAAHRQRAHVPRHGRVNSVKPLAGDLVVVLSLLAHATGVEHEAAHVAATGPRGMGEAFAAGWSRLGIPGPIPSVLPPGKVSAADVEGAFARISEASPGVKRRVVTAAAYAAGHDGQIRPAEAELLRAFLAALDVPLGPLVPQPDDEGPVNGTMSAVVLPPGSAAGTPPPLPTSPSSSAFAVLPEP